MQSFRGFHLHRHPSATKACDNESRDFPFKIKWLSRRSILRSIHLPFSIAARRSLPCLQSEVPSMTKIFSLVTATAVASLLLMGSAFAQATAPAKDATKK